ncbi:predicted protein, partial [Nematostella vectensis]
MATDVTRPPLDSTSSTANLMENDKTPVPTMDGDYPTTAYPVDDKHTTGYPGDKNPPDVKLAPTHPYWIGAWWLGPLAAGLGVMFCGVIILGFPRHLPGAYAVRKEALRSGEMKKDDSHLKGNIRDILPATKNLLMNGTYIFQNLATTFGTLVGFGLYPFMYKVINERYGAGSLLTGVVIAVLLVPSVSLGLLIGSYLVRRFRVRRSCHRAARLTFFLQILGIWGALNMLIPGCPYSNYAGVDVAYDNRSSQKIALENPCNVGCLCSAGQYSPVNGGEGVTFFSPCYAGCPPQKPTKVPCYMMFMMDEEVDDG